MPDEQLEKVAAKLDDISEALDELKGEAEDGAPVSERRLEAIESHVEHAAEVIEESVDPD